MNATGDLPPGTGQTLMDDMGFDSTVPVTLEKTLAPGKTLATVIEVPLNDSLTRFALAAVGESLNIARHIVLTEPDNIDWQRDVSVSLERLGNIKSSTGDKQGALQAYEEMLSIDRRVADDHCREVRPVHLRLRPGRRLDPTPRPAGRQELSPASGAQPDRRRRRRGSPGSRPPCTGTARGWRRCRSRAIRDRGRAGRPDRVRERDGRYAVPLDRGLGPTQARGVVPGVRRERRSAHERPRALRRDGCAASAAQARAWNRAVTFDEPITVEGARYPEHLEKMAGR